MKGENGLEVSLLNVLKPVLHYRSDRVGWLLLHHSPAAAVLDQAMFLTCL